MLAIALRVAPFLLFLPLDTVGHSAARPTRVTPHWEQRKMRFKRPQERLILAGQLLAKVERSENVDSDEQPETVVADEAATDWLDRVRGDLEARGVASDLATTLALQLCQRQRCEELTLGQYESLIDGASVASGVHIEATGDPSEGIDRVRDIERMMQAFSSELSKLDENLEVLSAYVRRMRSQPAAAPAPKHGKTLH